MPQLLFIRVLSSHCCCQVHVFPARNVPFKLMSMFEWVSACMRHGTSLQGNMSEDPKFYNLEEVDALALKVLPKAVSIACHAEQLQCGVKMTNFSKRACRSMTTLQPAQTQKQQCATTGKHSRGSDLCQGSWSMSQTLT